MTMTMIGDKGVAAVVLACLGWLGTNAGQAQIPFGDIVIELEPVASGLVSPIGVTHAGDGSGRLFIWEQTGQILIVEGGVLLATPFLDIADQLPALNAPFDERGLLGLAFHPNYATNRFVYTNYTDLNGDTVVSTGRSRETTPTGSTTGASW